ncbi:hypothetical protein N9746_03645 [Candidatus Thioglobus sp.]|nr:hypothetical protein [Candidatus Thioglobus sp.]
MIEEKNRDAIGKKRFCMATEVDNKFGLIPIMNKKISENKDRYIRSQVLIWCNNKYAITPKKIASPLRSTERLTSSPQFNPSFMPSRAKFTITIIESPMTNKLFLFL